MFIYSFNLFAIKNASSGGSGEGDPSGGRGILPPQSNSSDFQGAPCECTHGFVGVAFRGGGGLVEPLPCCKPRAGLHTWINT